MRRMLHPWAPVAALLGAAALLHLGYRVLVTGLDRRDAGQYETVLARATASQLVGGPGLLYGPYSGDHPSVLMHAPTYYRLAGLAAAIPSRLGLDPLDAALVAGRLLSVAATLALLALSWRLARLDGAGPRAGFGAAALVASSPILGVLAIMVRADALGVALATGGCLLTLKALRDAPGRRPEGRLAAAYALFALAVGVKQQNLFVPAVSTIVLGIAWWRGRVGLAALATAVAVGASVGAALLGIEDVWTGGRMWRTVFELPGGAFRAINYGGWPHVQTILLDCARRSVGLLALGAIGAGLALRSGTIPRLDRILVAYLGVEVVALVPLCLFNKGAADNYALQAVVLAAVLVGRWIDRAIGATPVPVAAWVALTAAALGLLANDLRLIRHEVVCRRGELATLDALIADPMIAGHSPAQRYVVGNQGWNRLFGRRDLIHDEWLYGAFEAIGDAEPRAGWLREAVTTGPVRQIIAPREAPSIPGIPEPLPALGYARLADHGPFAVWVRR